MRMARGLEYQDRARRLQGTGRPGGPTSHRRTRTQRPPTTSTSTSRPALSTSSGPAGWPGARDSEWRMWRSLRMDKDPPGIEPEWTQLRLIASDSDPSVILTFEPDFDNS
jgi:hypothetical protein